MKHIVLFTNSMESGGAERQLSVLANLLHTGGYKVTVTTINDTPDHYQLKQGINRIKLCKSKYNSFRKYLILVIYFLSVKCDCIISYGQRENFLILIPLMLRINRPKLLCSERSFTYGEPSPIEKVLVKYLYRFTDYIIPNSYSQSTHLICANKKLKNKVKTIINYTDLTTFSFQNPPHNNIPKIGLFCRYEKVKNCINFVSAMKKVKGSGIPFFIEWYGSKIFSTPELQDYYNNLLDLIKTLNLEDVIHLNDATKDVKNEIQYVDIVALPSFYEGFSNAISEAISCGKPMLVSNVSDNSILVNENVNGVLFDPNSVDDICEKTKYLLGLSTIELDQMGSNSRTIAERLFSKSKFFNSYIDLIES